MGSSAGQKGRPLLFALSTGVVAMAFACPKPPSPIEPNPPSTGNGSTGSTGSTDPFTPAQCDRFDWNKPEIIPAEMRDKCVAANYSKAFDACDTYDWTTGTAIPPAVKKYCEDAGYGKRVEECRAFNWMQPDGIAVEYRTFCQKIGFREVIDPELCEKQDWTKPDTILPTVKEQCLKIAFTPRCDPKKDPACVPPDDPKRKELFSHAGHGIDLPDQPRTRDLKIGTRGIECADCHAGECKTDKKGKIIGTVDINRPDHQSCGGIKTCHPDFLDDKKMCLSCHTAATAFKAPLRAYGGGDEVPIKDFGFDFSHASHLKADGAPAKRGKTANCDSCHTLDKKDKKGVKMTQAGHATCGACHCDTDAVVKMNDCLACHKGDSASKSGHSYLNWRPHAQSFTHKSHQIGPDGAKIECVTCHIAVTDSETMTEITVPPMLGCLQGCHDGAHVTTKKKPVFDGWIKCAECHAPGELPKSQTKAQKKKPS
jgi:hypothetical protein